MHFLVEYVYSLIQILTVVVIIGLDNDLAPIRPLDKPLMTYFSGA